MADSVYLQIDEFLRLCPDVQITDRQVRAARYLQSQSKRFLIDFGYANAEQIAWDILERQIAELPRQ